MGEMMNSRTMIPLVLLVIFLSGNALLQAEKSVAYGIIIRAYDPVFVSVDFETRKMKFLNQELPHGRSFSTVDALIDSKAGTYNYSAYSYTLKTSAEFALSLSDGRVVKSFPSPSAIANRHYDPIRQRIIGITRSWDESEIRQKIAQLTELNMENETARTIGQLPGEVVENSYYTFYDYHRNLYITYGSDEVFRVLDGQDASIVSRYTLDESRRISKRSISFNPLAANFFALERSISSSQMILWSFDPLSGAWQSQVELPYNGNGLLRTAFDALNGNIWIDHGAKRFAYDVNSGKIVNKYKNTPEIKGFRFVNKSVKTELRRIDGRVFVDRDGDCSFSADEPGLPMLVIEDANSNSLQLTGKDGRFSLYRKPGEYRITLASSDLWRVACGSATQTVLVEDANTGAYNIEFPLTAQASVRRLELSVSSSRAIVGRQITYRLQYRNTGSVPFSGKLIFCHDKILSDFDANPMAERYTVNIAEWDIESLEIGHSDVISVSLQVPADPSLNRQTLCAKLTTDQQGGSDISAGAAYSESCVAIRNSYDPNDIQVAPAGTGSEGSVSLIDTVLTYTVRFQNVGTAAARNVRVLDTLSEQFNIETLQLGAASHTYSVSLHAKNIVEWQFNNIELAPKREDEEGSQGFLSYKLHLRQGLPVNSEIRNRAAIYFDYNEPIITNTVRTTLRARSTSVDDLNSPDANIAIAVDDVNRNVEVNSDQELWGKAEIYNIVGQQVFAADLAGIRQLTLRLGHIPIGRYLLKFDTKEGLEVKSFTLVR